MFKGTESTTPAFTGQLAPSKEKAMATWFHASVLATAFAATVAVGIASASMLVPGDVAQKADRLPVVADASSYVTIETRHDGVSVLKRIQIN
jgi:hypothetical protein